MEQYDALPLIAAAVVLIIGLFILVKGGSKWGWLFIAGAAYWAYVIMQPVIEETQPGRTTPEQNRRGYYRDPSE